MIAYFADRLSNEDKHRYGIQEGSAEAQQILECLAALVALRLWLPIWQSERITLRVRADNYTVLAMVSRMKASTPQLRMIAAELALVLTDSCYMPWVAEHTPGVQNVVADTLSRKFEPGVAFTLPAILTDAKCCTPPPRDSSWYRADALPEG